MKRAQRTIQVLRYVSYTLNFVFLLNYSSCRSSDLGHAPADRVPTNLSLTGWDSGAGAVVAAKCANCHTPQRSKFVPANTPHELDEISNIEFFKNPENLGLVISMRKRVESVNSTSVMPPRFATPLYEEERIALLNFLNMVENGGLYEPKIPPKPECKKVIVSAAQQSILSQKETLVSVSSNSVSDIEHIGPTTETSVEEDPCPKIPPPIDPPPVEPPTDLTFADIAPIVMTACGGCHDGGRLVKLQTREDFYDMKPAPLEEILAGSMPRRNPNWKDSDDGKLVIQWLQGTQEQ